MPCPRPFRHQPGNPAVLIDKVMAADFAGRIAQALARGFGGGHAGVMQHQHVDGLAVAAVVIGRRTVSDFHVASPSIMERGRRNTIMATPIMVMMPPRITGSVSCSLKK